MAHSTRPWVRPVAKGFTPSDFSTYVSGLRFGGWRPHFVVLHHSGEPTFAEWHNYTGATRMTNLEHYYKVVRGWTAGPHLFVADDLIWVFTPLTVEGRHSPSWNHVAWGVEMVGNYMTETFSAAVRWNTIYALGTLHSALGLAPSTLRLHKEDPRTTHFDCPGIHVNKADVISATEHVIATVYMAPAWICGSIYCPGHKAPEHRCKDGNWGCGRIVPPCPRHGQTIDEGGKCQTGTKGEQWHCGRSGCATHSSGNDTCEFKSGHYFYCGRKTPPCPGHQESDQASRCDPKAALLIPPPFA